MVGGATAKTVGYRSADILYHGRRNKKCSRRDDDYGRLDTPGPRGDLLGRLSPERVCRGRDYCTRYGARMSLTARRHGGGRDVVTSVVRGCGVGPRPEHSVFRNVENKISCWRVSRPIDGGCAGREQKLSNGARGQIFYHVKNNKTSEFLIC